MSGVALVWAANVRGLAPATKIVLIQLAERCNKDTGICNPSLAKLTDDCEMSRASVLRHLKELEGVGLVTRVARGRDNGGRASSQYHLHMDRVVEREQKSQNETGGKGLNVSGQRSQIGGGKGRTDETPYIEPVLNLEEPPRERDLFESDSQKKPAAQKEVSILMEVLSEEVAQSFYEHRKEKRAKLTVKAAKLIVGKLKGHSNPDAVAEASIMNGWTGVFPDNVQAFPGRGSPQAGAPQQSNGDKIMAIFDRRYGQQ